MLTLEPAGIDAPATDEGAAELGMIGPEKPAGGTPPTILVVDDSITSLELVGRILRAEGFRTLYARGGEEALRISGEQGVDLILLDVMMPDEDGLRVCARLKSRRQTSDVPVIFLSACGDADSRVAGLKAGGVDYITKPFHAAEVLARVRVHLRIGQAARQQAEQQQARLEELRQAQQSMLVRPEDVPEAHFSVCYRPLGAAGGDFYDVLPMGEDIVNYFVADISGHSLGASFLTAAVKALLRQYSSPLFSPEETMRSVNSVMHSTLNDGQFLTACYARWYRRKKVMSVVSAAHPPLIHVDSGGAAGALSVQGDPLGVFGSVVLQKRDVRLGVGDRIYLYSDGLIEDHRLPGGGRGAGIEKLTAACERLHALPLEEVAEAIVEQVRPRGEAQHDDLLLMAIEAAS
jgi:sigma-B regulation protein RsbU (phosphoserine phosphatase)